MVGEGTGKINEHKNKMAQALGVDSRLSKVLGSRTRALSFIQPNRTTAGWSVEGRKSFLATSKREHHRGEHGKEKGEGTGREWRGEGTEGVRERGVEVREARSTDRTMTPPVPLYPQIQCGSLQSYHVPEPGPHMEGLRVPTTASTRLTFREYLYPSGFFHPDFGLLFGGFSQPPL